MSSAPADEDIFTPAITLWAMVSQFLFKQEGRSCKSAAGRVVSLLTQTAGRVVAQNAGNYCRAKAKTPIATIKKITLRLASKAEIDCLEFDDLTSVIDSDEAEERLSPRVIAEIRSLPVGGRIIIVDGFTIDGPDTVENQKKYPQNPVQEEGLGLPITLHYALRLFDFKGVRSGWGIVYAAFCRCELLFAS